MRWPPVIYEPGTFEVLRSGKRAVNLGCDIATDSTRAYYAYMCIVVHKMSALIT